MGSTDDIVIGYSESLYWYGSVILMNPVLGFVLSSRTFQQIVNKGLYHTVQALCIIR